MSIGDLIKRCVKKFTGYDKVEEVLRRSDRLTRRVRRTKDAWQHDMSRLEDGIQGRFKEIAELRKQLAARHFPRFIRTAAVFSEWHVATKNVNEELHIARAHFNCQVPAFVDDVRLHPWKHAVLSYVSLGCVTRRLAGEALTKVYRQESAFEHSCAKIEAELERHRLIRRSLAGVVRYLKELTVCYVNLLNKLQRSVRRLRKMHPTAKEDGLASDCLSQRDLLCLEAAEKLTRILNSIISCRYLTMKGVLIKGDISRATGLYIEARNITGVLKAA